MKRFLTNLLFALYCASIIIGAGVLTMPLTGRLLGFVPLLANVVVIGLWLIFIYNRLAHTFFTNVAAVARERMAQAKVAIARGLGVDTDNEEWEAYYQARMLWLGVQQGAGIIDEAIRRSGIGPAGPATLFLGMFFYVFFADIGYILAGNRSLNVLAGTIRDSSFWLWSVFLVAGAAMIATAVLTTWLVRPISSRWGSLLKFLMMAGWWGVAIGLLIVIDADRLLLGAATTGSVVGTTIFLAAIISATYTANHVTERDDQKGGLNAHHRMNVLVMMVELVLLALTAGMIVIVFARSGQFQPFYAFNWLNLTQYAHWSHVLGVVIFAYVGTGIFNLCSYPGLFDHSGPKGRARFSQVVLLGTLIPMALYLGWTLLNASTLSVQELTLADAADEPTHIVIARKVATISAQDTWLITLLITLTGYLFALMAVTSACNGFTESLADRIRITFPATKSWWKPLADWRPAILIGAAAAALAKDIFSVPIDLSAILSIAGNAGGGLLILILPFFFPYPFDRRSRARYWEIAVVVVTAAILVVGIVTESTEGTGWASLVLSWIKWLTAAGVAGMTIWLLISEPSEEHAKSERTSQLDVHLTDIAQ